MYAHRRASQGELFKADLSKEAQTRREIVAREIESGRAEAQRALEGFKAELTLDAEVRRQSAERKVDALVKIAAAMQSAVDAAYPLSLEDPVAQRNAGSELWKTVRALLVFVRPQLVAAIERFSSELQRYVVARQIPNGPGQTPDLVALHQAGETARNAVLDLIRRELYLKGPDSNLVDP